MTARLLPVAMLALGLAACGDTLVDHVGAAVEAADAQTSSAADAGGLGPGPDAGGGGGLICAADDPCTCAPCTAGSQCAAGLQCVEGKRKGQSCGFNVCLSGGP
ncbi:MAG: hypothetical protein QM765_34425 [Myxococcales bacterium]